MPPRLDARGSRTSGTPLCHITAKRRCDKISICPKSSEKESFEALLEGSSGIGENTEEDSVHGVAKRNLRETIIIYRSAYSYKHHHLRQLSKCAQFNLGAFHLWHPHSGESGSGGRLRTGTLSSMWMATWKIRARLLLKERSSQFCTWISSLDGIKSRNFSSI